MTTTPATRDDTARPGTPRPVKAAVDDTVEVRLTVNGNSVTLALPARLTLADALREHLGLTGTHLGCEHGVCGMCTVLVDGEAARACLLFAVQLDGCDIVTVEGLGTPGELHPLQESFGRNHALQCGFCTPGFLMSSYDLLTTKPGVTDEELPEEMSGVLCRCTGYRNILAAIAETRQAHPDGVPGPGNCARRALIGRVTGGAGVVPDGEANTGSGTETPGRDGDIVLPSGDPTAVVNTRTEIAVSENEVWRVLDDVPLLARCLPGAELTDDLGDNRYAGRAKVSVGPVKLAFTGTAHIIEHDKAGRRIRMLAQGYDTGGARTQAEIVLRTEATAQGTVLFADAAVYLTGRIAQFGRALAGDVSRRMFEQFADALSRTATSGTALPEPVATPSALTILAGTLGDRLRTALRRFRLTRRASRFRTGRTSTQPQNRKEGDSR
ncbi:xanthine dehydrogenase family Fe-S subunit [Haloechinothrix salitolerans]|uniref:2Fe-2S iron-sulfur cluster-binding protein n=1 Tax=Haloechinothrix salitolerans TaxID=926830 RepID=A0ABW2BTT5_9PSEU